MRIARVIMIILRPCWWQWTGRFIIWRVLPFQWYHICKYILHAHEKYKNRIRLPDYVRGTGQKSQESAGAIKYITVHIQGAYYNNIDNFNDLYKRQRSMLIIMLTLWLPGRSACQDPDILVWEFYFSSFKAGIADAISSFKWRKIHKCSIYLTKICVILWLRSLTNDDGNFRHVW